MTDLGSILGDVLRNYTDVPQSPNDVANVSHQEVFNHYQQFVQNAPTQQIYQANEQAYQQLPQDQKQGLFSTLLGALTQHGVSPQHAGVQGTAPTASNYAKIVQYASQNPGLLDKIFGQSGALSSPLAKMALAGALAVAANQMSNRGL